MPTALQPGARIEGRYEVRATLGRGSFGTTYAAQDLRGGGLVAIKELDLGRVDEWKTVELFEREARILANLDHPRIPDYIDLIPIRPDAPGYLVQELAPGRSLAARLEAGERFTEDQVRDIAQQLLEVLRYLGGLLPPVVHRDIKPGNIIIGDDGRCYLVDFGSVRNAVEASRTGGSTVAGTFGYMAPEQLHGDASARSDLFGLGMTLVHLLTGTSPAELGRRRLKVDYRSHVQVSEPLASFIDRLIEPVPEDRFGGAQPALDALAGITRLPAPVAEAMSGDALAQLAGAQVRRAEEQEARARALAQRQAEEVARRAKPRVKLHEDEQGITVVIEPAPLTRRLLRQIPFTLFAVINPGFAVVGGFPFFGRYWPIFADDFWARGVVWVLLLAVLNVVIAKARGRRLHLRVAGRHFAAWYRNPEQRLALGPVEELMIVTDEPGADGYGVVAIRMGDTSKSIGRLSARDLATLQLARERIAAAGEPGS